MGPTKNAFMNESEEYARDDVESVELETLIAEYEKLTTSKLNNVIKSAFKPSDDTVKYIERVNIRKLAYIIRNSDKLNIGRSHHGGGYIAGSDQVKLFMDYFIHCKTEDGGEYATREVKYCQTVPGCGRFQSQGFTLQNMARPVRHTILKDKSLDFDICNAHPLILANLAKQAGLECPALDEFNNTYKKYRVELAQYLKCDVETSKRAFLKLLNYHCDIDTTFKDMPVWFRELAEEVRDVRAALLLRNPEYVAIAILRRKESESKESDFNIAGSAINYMLQDYENKALSCCVDVANRKGYKIEVLVYDGLVLCADGVDVEDFTTSCNCEIRDQLDMNLKVVNKPFDEALEFEYELTAATSWYTEVRDFIIEKCEELDQWQDPLEQAEFDEEPPEEGARGYAAAMREWKRAKKEFEKEQKEIAEERANRIKKLYINFINNWLLFCVYDMNHYMFVITQLTQPVVMIRGFDECSKTKIKYATFTSQTCKAFMDANVNLKYSAHFGSDSPHHNRYIAKAWLEFSKRRQYHKRVFKPLGEEKPTEFNTFQGININFDIARERAVHDGSADIFKNYIKRIWANNRDNVAEYLLNYMAHLVQKPAVKAKVALCLLGREGSGKSIIFDQFLQYILGPQHCTTPTSADSITGNFNSLLMDKILVYMSELHFAGNHKEANILKKLITQEMMTINIKGIPQFDVENLFNIIIDSNNKHIINAGENSRRYLVIETSNELCRCFANGEVPELIKQLLGCNIYDVALMLHTRDISNFDPADFPRTKELFEQKLISMAKGNTRVPIMWCDVLICMRKAGKFTNENYMMLKEYLNYADCNETRAGFWKVTYDIFKDMNFEERRLQLNNSRDSYIQFNPCELLKCLSAYLDTNPDDILLNEPFASELNPEVFIKSDHQKN